ARMYDSLGPSNGAHVGTGTGYYSAILVEIVGRSGRVTAIEIDPALAAAAKENLAAWPQARVEAADGFMFCPDCPADAILVNAGVTHLVFGLARYIGSGRRPSALAADECRMVGLLVMITRLNSNPDR